jgi:hypothetical protein
VPVPEKFNYEAIKEEFIAHAQNLNFDLEEFDASSNIIFIFLFIIVVVV